MNFQINLGKGKVKSINQTNGLKIGSECAGVRKSGLLPHHCTLSVLNGSVHLQLEENAACHINDSKYKDTKLRKLNIGDKIKLLESFTFTLENYDPTKIIDETPKKTPGKNIQTPSKISDGVNKVSKLNLSLHEEEPPSPKIPPKKITNQNSQFKNIPKITEEDVVTNAIKNLDISQKGSVDNQTNQKKNQSLEKPTAQSKNEISLNKDNNESPKNEVPSPVKKNTKNSTNNKVQLKDSNDGQDIQKSQSPVDDKMDSSNSEDEEEDTQDTKNQQEPPTKKGILKNNNGSSVNKKVTIAQEIKKSEEEEEEDHESEEQEKENPVVKPPSTPKFEKSFPKSNKTQEVNPQQPEQDQEKKQEQPSEPKNDKKVLQESNSSRHHKDSHHRSKKDKSKKKSRSKTHKKKYSSSSSSESSSEEIRDKDRENRDKEDGDRVSESGEEESVPVKHVSKYSLRSKKKVVKLNYEEEDDEIEKPYVRRTIHHNLPILKKGDYTQLDYYKGKFYF